MTYTVVYEQRPVCHTCQGYLKSWIMFHETPRCEECEDRLIAMSIRRICHRIKHDRKDHPTEPRR